VTFSNNLYLKRIFTYAIHMNFFYQIYNGTLIQIITRKIRDLFELSGLPTTPAKEFYEIDLPIHLKSLYDSYS
jgi:hypothetical protein